MNTLIVSTAIFPVGGTGYGGIEKLVSYTARELARRGHAVVVAAPTGSVTPPWVRLIQTGPCGDFMVSELAAYYEYRPYLSQFDAILDYSHSKWAMRMNKLPAIGFIWHDPKALQCPEPDYNVAALSVWQAARFQEIYKQQVKVLDPHLGPSASPLPSKGRFLIEGKIGEKTGVLDAIAMCKELEVGLDIIGVPGPGDPPELLDKVKKECGNGITYWGGVSDEARMEFEREAQALIYPVTYPPGQGEAHSHKSVSVLLTGCPVVTYDQGALSEVIAHGDMGFLAVNRTEFKDFMLQAGELKRDVIAWKAKERWGFEATGDRLVKALEEVAKGSK